MSPADVLMGMVFIGFLITCMIYLVVTHEDDNEQQHRPR